MMKSETDFECNIQIYMLSKPCIPLICKTTSTLSLSSLYTHFCYASSSPPPTNSLSLALSVVISFVLAFHLWFFRMLSQLCKLQIKPKSEIECCSMLFIQKQSPSTLLPPSFIHQHSPSNPNPRFQLNPLVCEVSMSFCVLFVFLFRGKFFLFVTFCDIFVSI